MPVRCKKTSYRSTTPYPYLYQSVSVIYSATCVCVCVCVCDIIIMYVLGSGAQYTLALPKIILPLPLGPHTVT